MRLAPEVEKLLLPSARIPNYCPDEYDVDISMIIKNWREVDRCDVGIVGVPFDTATVSRRGSKWGPQGIRSGLVAMTSYEPAYEVDLAEGIAVADFGDVDVVHTNVVETHSRIERVVAELCRHGVIPLILGGDHSITYPNVKGLCNATKGSVGVINFDAHLDVRLSRHGEISSGTSFRKILDEIPGKPVRPQNLVEVGISGWHNTKFWRDYTKQVGIPVITAREVHLRGIHEVVEDVLKHATAGVEAVYVSIDMDCLDQAFAPGTNVPGQGGLTSFQLLEAVFAVGRHPAVRGFDIVEVSPPLDPTNVTSFMAAALLMQILGAVKARKS